MHFLYFLIYFLYFFIHYRHLIGVIFNISQIRLSTHYFLPLPLGITFNIYLLCSFFFLVVVLGFEDPMKICCGSFNDQYVACGEREFDGNGTMTGSNTACENPSKYISWDGKHYTEAANQFLAKLIINGSLSDPPISLSEACQKPCLN